MMFKQEGELLTRLDELPRYGSVTETESGK